MRLWEEHPESLDREWQLEDDSDALLRISETEFSVNMTESKKTRHGSLESFLAKIAHTKGSQCRFTKCSVFSLEIRLIIWEYALPGSRNVAIYSSKMNNIPVLILNTDSRTLPTSYLYTNNESRNVALKFYKPLTLQFTKPIYFNFDSEVLRIDGNYELDELCGSYNEKLLSKPLASNVMA
ncbi:hypothetical protein QTJ16_003576 [Diplocarpon rosae]|uniref:2EXR domain-containing protein n=1 Tax=Diplocarpon rosae TaxID=946125 RepID=A0AAD9T1G0_9HELO|nr:hypothetical protein QTJ16_003576 [Diplocarpon rosae]PBP23725.1 hypothetical protein BUE80_DR005406 [Diplocarpon rosae]